jgi:hypothetical protein
VTVSLTGWVDYDRSYLAGLNPAERIDYFERRVRLVVINPLRRILATEILLPVSEHSSAVLIFGVALCCAIEATGKFLTGGKGGRDKNWKRFNTFVHHYMSSEFQTKKIGSMTYAKALWVHFRNGLAHGFVVRHGGFEGAATEPYFLTRKIAGTDSLEVNPTRFLDDYMKGFERYLANLRAAVPTGRLFVDFNDVFEAVFVKGH